ncbi:MAG TPA: hypothetical protein VD997_07490 [Phycisphaerales bacterium]|nr:hypothetical protein [Phycisphaerales bacterium]
MPEPTPTLRPQRIGLALSTPLLAAFAAAAPRLLSLLASAPDDEASIDRTISDIGALALAVAAALAPILIITPASLSPELRRLHRFAAWTVGLAAAFWILPTPFWIGRLITYAGLAALAAAYLIIFARSAFNTLRARPQSPWTAPIAALGCILSTALLPLTIAYTNLAWQRGID